MKRSTRVNLRILLISAAVWAALLVEPWGAGTLTHCPVSDSGASAASLQMMLEMNPFWSLMAGWALMLVAMMGPTLLSPIQHILKRSFKKRFTRSALFFVLGYGVVWMAAGVVIVAAVIALNLFFPRSYLPTIVVGLIAVVWQFSPIKQRSLNRNHNHRELAAFGYAADIDLFRFGFSHGLWCVASCWALMLFPMLVPQAHFTAMALDTYIMISERLESPAVPKWRLRFPDKLFRIAIAQFRIRYARLAIARN